jgi:hypothetical protein
MAAALHGHLEVLRLLLVRGAVVDPVHQLAHGPWHVGLPHRLRQSRTGRLDPRDRGVEGAIASLPPVF